MFITEFNTLKKNTKKSFKDFVPVKLAILGDNATQLMNIALKGYGYQLKTDLNIYESDYNQIEQEVFNFESGLYSFEPDFVLIFHSVERMNEKFYKSDYEQRETFFQNELDTYSEIVNIISEKLSAKIIFLNFPVIVDSVFGHFANKTKESFTYQLRKINLSLSELSQKNGNVFICDIEGLQSRYGLQTRKDNKIFIKADMAFSLDMLPLLAKHILDIILSIKGNKLKKCLILDLDHTIWGGVIGDDGVEKIQIGKLGIGKAFSNLQRWAKALKDRGIILCVCSKNTDSIARKPFDEHPEMILRISDIAVFVANWENKADNIRYIQSVLNIGFDSMVFLDDNPFERNLVRQELPEVLVPELPEDPAEYMDFITEHNLFETASISSEDRKRTSRYQKEAERSSSKRSFSSIDDYLESLNMVAKIELLNVFNIPRIAQLSQRSNQFNLRTVRYTEEELHERNKSNQFLSLAVSLNDKYGDYGIISALMCEKKGETLFIENWMMSCRVLNRGVENAVLDYLIEYTKKNKLKFIIGEYLPTKKNGIVEDHYKKLEFQFNKGLWKLSSKVHIGKNKFISITD